MAGNDICYGGRHHTVIDVNDRGHCIFRVPTVLRSQNPDAYSPHVVSIGPFHHHHHRGKDGGQDKGKEDREGNKEEFQLMQAVKNRYLNEILSSMDNITIEKLTEKVIELSHQKNEGKLDKFVRNFYAKSFKSKLAFMKMMIVDGCFLIQLFRKCNDEGLRQSDDPVFNRDFMFNFLCHDLLLLENQLPWFILEILYGLILGNCQSHSLSLSILVLDSFIKFPSLKQSCESYKQHLLAYHPQDHHCRGHGYANILHILDLLRATIVVPMIVKDGSKKKGQVDPIFDPDAHEMYSATALSEAGFKFKRNKTAKSIMDIEFKKGWVFKNGDIMIPQLNVGMLSESLFRNLIAFEQCYRGYSNEITSYAMLMDNLITSKEDMVLLRKAKVIGNWLSSEEDACKFFNNLYKGIPHSKFYYANLCKDVKIRYEIKWYSWMASFKTEKLSNPWTVAAFLVGIILLALSLWTSINSIRNYMRK